MKNDFVNSADGLRDITAETVRLARAAGADMAEASAAESFGMEVSVRGGGLDGMDIGRSQGLSLTAYVGGAFGTANVGELTPAAMREAVERALVIARAAAPDEHAGLAEAELMATEFPELDLYHPWALSPDEAVELARRAEEAAWAADAAVSRDKNDGAALQTDAALSAYANSRGFCAAKRMTTHSLSVGVVAERDGDMQSDGWSEVRCDAVRLPSPEDIGAIAGRRAAERLGSKKLRARRAAVLFRESAARSLIGHFISAASGGALYRKMSWLCGRLGEQIFPPHINIRELPHLPGELHSDAYDDDGVATQARDVVAAGVWRGCFLSAYSARRMAMKTTGNAGGAHNLEVSGDTVAADDLPAMLGEGLIVTHLMGQGANGITGDYSRGAAGFWVENGEIVHPASEVTIAGNLSDMLASIAAVGDDAKWRGGAIKCGSLLLPDMALGGNE